MKRICFLLILLITLAGCQVTASPTDHLESGTPTRAISSSPSQQVILPDPELFPVSWDERSDFTAGLIPSQQDILTHLPGATIYHILVDIQDDLSRLNGLMEVRYTNRETVPLNEIYFRLLPNLYQVKMTTANVKVNKQDAASEAVGASSSLRVDLPTPLEPETPIVISMEFTIELPPGGGNGLNFVYNSQILALAQFYPLIPVYDEAGWHIEIPSASGDPTYADPGFFRVQVTAPSQYMMAASGVEEEPKIDGTRQVQVFRAGPVRDFYLCGGTGYTSLTTTRNGIVVNSYSLPSQKEGARLALDTAAAAIDSFNQRFAPYPYSEFDIVTIPTAVLGIEYPGITAINEDLYDLEGNVRGTPNEIYMESTVAHETGHQWFYNLVGSDQLNEPWLDEAVTQYATALYYLDAYGRSGEEGYIESWYARWDRVNREEIPIGLPVAAYDSTNSYSPIVYGRGPIFLSKLSDKLGEEKFNTFLKKYVEIYSWNIANTGRFKELAEESCGCKLTSLFKEWVFEK